MQNIDKKVFITNTNNENININNYIENNYNDFFYAGILSILIDAIYYLFGVNKLKKEEKYLKNKTYNPKTKTYLDSKCVEHLYSDDSLVFTRRNQYGEFEIEYQNGIRRNISQEKYNKQSGTVTRLAGYDFHNKNHYFTTAIGFRYVDKSNGKIYVIRNLEYKNCNFLFYMDVENGEIIRPTDGQLTVEQEAKKQNRKYYDGSFFNEAIKYFNNNINNFDVPSLFRNRNNAVDLSDKNIMFATKCRKEI